MFLEIEMSNFSIKGFPCLGEGNFSSKFGKGKFYFPGDFPYSLRPVTPKKYGI